MTEVAGLLLPADHRLATVRHYPAGPPEGLELVEPAETFATTKEEEWVSKKKTEVTNTKQIETRVKRQVVLEDGKVVGDTGPMVTTNTTEDTETQEHHQTELRKLGNDDVDGPQDAIEGASGGKQVVAASNPDGVVREVKEKRVISREETEEVKETEDIQHFGDITDEDFLAAVNSGKQDIRRVLRTRLDTQAVASTGPRVLRDTTKSTKITDTENKRDLSSVLPDGKIVTETQRTTEHEEVNDDELPEDVPARDSYKENSQRYLKTREQEDVDYVADGVKIGHEMKFKTETMEVEKRGDGDEPDFDSLSARVRKRAGNNGRQPHRYRGIENGAVGASPLDRKDALTRRPLDFDQEEETRKVETSKWLEHHFGSESRSSGTSVADEEIAEEKPPKTSFFNVTIKSQPTRSETFLTTVNQQQQQQQQQPPPRVYSPVNVEPAERDREYHKWSDRRQVVSTSPINYIRDNNNRSPLVERYQQRSPIPDYVTTRESTSPALNYRERMSPIRDVAPTPPQRKRGSERRYAASSRLTNGIRSEPLEEPPPDYSPPMPTEKKLSQKTRFAPEPPKQKSGNIIGQSIRKLVGKIRSASAERKAKQRAKRSPSPSYQKGHVIDNNIGGGGGNMENSRPVQRYYLGEDPFAGSIYGRENKYDGVKPARSSRRVREEEHRSQSTLGRFSKSTSRLLNASPEAHKGHSSQTLPRHLNRHEPPTRLEKNGGTINVSFVNKPGPAKPARTYKSNLSRSKSLNVSGPEDYRRMYTSNPHLNRLDENPVGLKSPGLISSLSRSQKDLYQQQDTGRFSSPRNGISDSHFTGNNNNNVSKSVFMTSLKDRAPELFKTLQENDGSSYKTSTPIRAHYNGDIYEPPTRLTTNQQQQQPMSILRRGSNSSTDFSETYHTTTRSDNPHRPSVTNTVKTVSKKTIPSRDGRSMETIESSETKSVTKSSSRGQNDPNVKFYETERRYSAGSPVVIEVRNTNFRK